MFDNILSHLKASSDYDDEDNIDRRGRRVRFADDAENQPRLYDHRRHRG
jgi:hypothetical protein